MKLRKCLLTLITAGALLVASAPFALAWEAGTDVFDWGMANASTKEQIVTDLQEILINKGILKKRYTASSLVAVVEKQLAIDNEQAIILDKMCLGLKLNCDSVLP